LGGTPADTKKIGHRFHKTARRRRAKIWLIASQWGEGEPWEGIENNKSKAEEKERRRGNISGMEGPLLRPRGISRNQAHPKEKNTSLSATQP